MYTALNVNRKYEENVPPLPSSEKKAVDVRWGMHYHSFISFLLSLGFTSPLPTLCLPLSTVSETHSNTYITHDPYTHACAGNEEEARMSTVMEDEFNSVEAHVYQTSLKGPVCNIYLLGYIGIKWSRKYICMFFFYLKSLKIVNC